MRWIAFVLAMLACSAPAAAATGDVTTSYGPRTPNLELHVDPSASTSTVKCEWCLTAAVSTFTGNCVDRASGAAVPALQGAKNVTIDNRSSVTAYIEWDGSNVTTDGKTGDKWAAGDKFSQDVRTSVFLPQATGAATGTQTTGACMFVRQWK